jgi:5-methyltetrahydropteroyltriglutamate--homocysteine methyltransferase
MMKGERLMDLPYGELKTTVVGSFPLQHSADNMRRVLSDQIEAGINFPCYGQLLDMNMMFLEPLAKEGCGIQIIDGSTWITDYLRKPKEPIGLEFLELAQDYLKENPSEKVDGIKVPITGPITLSSVTRISDHHNAIEYPDFILTFSEVVAEIVRRYDELGAGLITIDEPTLEYAVWLGVEEDLIIKAIDKPVEAVKNSLPSIHFCGDPSVVGNILLQSKAPILDHEFKASPKNLDFYTRSALEKADKMIGFGCVDSEPDPQPLLDIRDGKKQWMEVVESVEEIEKFILEGGRRFGLERLIIDPDCGFGGMKGYFKDDTGQKIAAQKLRNMVKATKKVKEKYLEKGAAHR